jgi:NADP-reducing hydrogenase subunit HndC
MAFRNYILVCGGTACESSHADQIYQNLVKECKDQVVADDVQFWLL